MTVNQGSTVPNIVCFFCFCQLFVKISLFVCVICMRLILQENLQLGYAAGIISSNLLVGLSKLFTLYTIHKIRT